MYSTLWGKCFQVQFWTLQSTPTGKCMKVKLHVFWLGHFVRSKIKSESIFLIKYYKIIILNKIWHHFGLYLTKPKIGFPIVFSNLARKVSGFFSSKEANFFLMDFIYLLYSRDGPWSLDFVITTYSYPLTVALYYMDRWGLEHSTTWIYEDWSTLLHGYMRTEALYYMDRFCLSYSTTSGYTKRTVLILISIKHLLEWLKIWRFPKSVSYEIYICTFENWLWAYLEKSMSDFCDLFCVTGHSLAPGNGLITMGFLSPHLQTIGIENMALKSITWVQS